MWNHQWKTDMTTKPEEMEPPTLQEQAKELLDNLLGKFKALIWILVFLVFVIVFFSFFSSETAREDNPTNYNSGSSEYQEYLDEEKDIEATEDEMNLYWPLLSLMEQMKHNTFDMEGRCAREFGESLFPESTEIRFNEVSINRADGTVIIRYDQGVNRKVVLKFERNNVTKVVTKYNGFSGGNPLGFLWWHTYVKFYKGYPRYTYTATVPDNFPGNPQYNETISRNYLYRKMLSRLRRVFGGD